MEIDIVAETADVRACIVKTVGKMRDQKVKQFFSDRDAVAFKSRLEELAERWRFVDFYTLNTDHQKAQVILTLFEVIDMYISSVRLNEAIDRFRETLKYVFDDIDESLRCTNDRLDEVIDELGHSAGNTTD